MSDIRQFDRGTKFKAQIVDANGAAINISSAISMSLLFKKPGVTTPIEKPAIFVTDGTDGWIYYESDATFLDTTGGWKCQGRVELPSGEWSSTINTFRVEKNLDS